MNMKDIYDSHYLDFRSSVPETRTKAKYIHIFFIINHNITDVIYIY